MRGAGRGLRWVMNDHSAPALSVLDLVPVRTGQTSDDAVAASLALVRRADDLGYRRYWFAEHHNMPAVASTTPPVLIAAAVARTERIRVGSGGVMLPNHAPLIVAEQFAALEAIAPGRIDLGIGRAPGSDPVITHLLRSTGTTSEVDQFPQNVADIVALMSPEGAAVRFSAGGEYEVHATPAATHVPDVWLLGSSDYSARLAASFGLPYVFANHFAGEGMERILELYRGQFQPSEACPRPRTFATANVVVAPTVDEAEDRALPQLRMMARLRFNQPLLPLETVEEVRAGATDPAVEEVMQKARSRWFVGTPDQVAADLTEFAARHDVDEVMISPVVGTYEGEKPDVSPGREQTLTLLAGALAG
jgi:luciferase family oxidoreductase group 1